MQNGVPRKRKKQQFQVLVLPRVSPPFPRSLYSLIPLPTHKRPITPQAKGPSIATLNPPELGTVDALAAAAEAEGEREEVEDEEGVVVELEEELEEDRSAYTEGVV